MAAAFAIGTERQKRATVNRVVRIGSVAALIVDSPADGNGLAATARHFNFAVGGCASSHVNHDGWLFFSGESDGDGIGAEHALHAPERRDELGGIGHGPTDHVALESLQN